jgi:hypothetical protein
MKHNRLSCYHDENLPRINGHTTLVKHLVTLTISKGPLPRHKKRFTATFRWFSHTTGINADSRSRGAEPRTLLNPMTLVNIIDQAVCLQSEMSRHSQLPTDPQLVEKFENDADVLPDGKAMRHSTVWSTEGDFIALKVRSSTCDRCRDHSHIRNPLVPLD